MKAAAVLGSAILVALSSDGAAARPEVTYWEPTWAPRGNTIAFVDRGRSAGDLYLIEADGSNLHKLTASRPGSNSYAARHPTWSPDGTRIAFGYGHDGISVVRSDGSALDRITKSGDMPAWSPRGRRIAYMRIGSSAASIWVMRPSGTGKTRVASPRPAGRTLFAPAWSPDGGRLAFSVGNLPRSVTRPGHLGVIRRYRGPVSRLLRNRNPSFVDWSPNGKALAVEYNPVTDATVPNLHTGVFDLRTRRLRRLRPGTHPTWSPDGRQLAFAYRGEIWIMNADGTGARRLVHGSP